MIIKLIYFLIFFNHGKEKNQKNSEKGCKEKGCKEKSD